MELSKLFNPLAKTSKQMEDHALYQITTNSHNYCGCIVHQNEMMIKLQSREGKPVKILKENIRSIVVL